MPTLVRTSWKSKLRAGEHGYTIIEVTMTLVILLVGLLGLMLGFSSAGRLSLVSERHATMTQVAQREIERIEGVPFPEIALSSSPTRSTDPTSPDYYVSGDEEPMLQWDRNSPNLSEPLAIDPQNGVVSPVQDWSEGSGPATLSGLIYEYVSWATDSDCSSQCPASGEDYKRITVAVTMAGDEQPNPVYVSSVVADPSTAPKGGVINGQTGNPLKNPATLCQNGAQLVSCVSPIDSGQGNVWFLHDWSSWNTTTPQPPSADHVTHSTVAAATGLLCTALSIVPALTAGCPQPDLMDGNPPSNAPGGVPCYRYSSDQAGTPGCGRLLQSTNDTNCSQGGSAFSTLLNVNSEFWVTSPLTATTTLTGDGGLAVWTQTAGSVNAFVTFCIAIYDVPPSGNAAGSLANILSWPPVYLGAATYQPPADPTTGANWPTGTSSTSFVFNFRGSSGTVQVAPGHRIGVRIWANVSGKAAIAVLYDNPLYPAQLQLNSK
jgi:Tfp pilus assembly protein PilV